MTINRDITAVIEGSAFICLTTVGADQTPHMIVTGKGQVCDDTIVFGIYKMDTTQKNLKANKNAWVVAAIRDGGPKGYRLTGTAEARDKQLIFTPDKAEALI
jgi:predicted pyridoxine 5'-phosphate oxidase superfamily flavin-nucleotide-binding protein